MKETLKDLTWWFDQYSLSLNWSKSNYKIIYGLTIVGERKKGKGLISVTELFSGYCWTMHKEVTVDVVSLEKAQKTAISRFAKPFFGVSEVSGFEAVELAKIAKLTVGQTVDLTATKLFYWTPFGGIWKIPKVQVFVTAYRETGSMVKSFAQQKFEALSYLSGEIEAVETGKNLSPESAKNIRLYGKRYVADKYKEIRTRVVHSVESNTTLKTSGEIVIHAT